VTVEVRRVELAGEVADRVLRVVAEITERWEEVIDDAGLTAPQVKLLRHLLIGGDTTMGGVAELLACDPSLATVAVDRLERRGLVVRVPDATDRRVRRVHPSPAGDVLVQGVWRQMAQATPLARLNDQQLAGLQEILDAMLGQRE
jgi:DNA-binding MarR family transcriptional regulator